MTGERLSGAAYEKHLHEMLPTPEDEAFLAGVFKEHDWIEPKKAGAAV